MKYLIFFIFLLLGPSFALAQMANKQIEITPYIRMDWYPEFSYRIVENGATTYYVKMRGTSWGITANYKWPINNKTFYAKMGISYFRYSFNEMDNHSILFGRNKSRVIRYPSPIYALFTTDKYWYNTISLNVGIEKWFDINNGMQLGGGVNVNNYFSFSQYYRITANYPTGPPNHKYTTRNNRYFGLSININAGLLKKMGKINIGPSIIFPVFDLWKKDKIFWEENSDMRDKWFRGISFGISFNYLLNKK